MDVAIQNTQKAQHIMFSYEWKSESLVSKIFFYLTKVQSIPVWMDKYGGINQCLTTSMAEGVENCCVFVCFLTPEYQESLNCKKELTYAVQKGKPIIPCLVGNENKNEKWKPSQWLGLTISDMVYLNFRNINEINFENKCQELIDKINSIIGIKRSESPHQTIIIEDESDEEDFQISSSFVPPEIIHEGPQINDEILEIIPKIYSSEGDSSIRLINQSKEIECNQDLYARNGKFFNSFTFPHFIFHNTSSEYVGILQLSAQYENNCENSNKWISCQLILNQDQQIINIEPNKLLLCSITIKIELNGSPGVDNQHRFRAHHLLPQPLKLKINIEDTQMKHASLIIEQVNRPLNLPTLEKLIDQLNICQSNILGFVSADDCLIEIRYFALVYYSNDENSFIKFSFGCDLSSRRSPSWDKQYVKNLQKKAKQEKKFELIVHENIFDPFIHCLALFDHCFRLQAIYIKIKTNTSITIQTISLPIQQIF
ncbi:unnamed protein product [Rotaria sordida]|uniref:TIR domain-containing protein n=1 Tax=Rotaria sordida TaxID=392033 RepID=A0A819CMJ5_9BILA|nr:unnamed protein product [Rotaria sordida]